MYGQCIHILELQTSKKYKWRGRFLICMLLRLGLILARPKFCPAHFTESYQSTGSFEITEVKPVEVNTWMGSHYCQLRHGVSSLLVQN